MANGDAASAAGLEVFAGTDKARNGYDALNIRGDELAKHMTDGGHAFSKITGTAAPAQIPALDASKITTGTSTRPVSTSGTVSSIGAMNAGGGLGIGGTGRGFDGVGNVTCGNVSAGDIYTPSGRNNPVTSNWVAAGIDGSGRIGIQPSARRFKKFIRPWSDARLIGAMLDLQPVRYQHRHGDGRWELGYIAEEVLEAGFGAFVPTDVNPDSDTYGEPVSVDYARFVVPLIAHVKTLTARIDALEARA